MKIKIQIQEGFHTTIWKRPIEIDTDNYPELEGMSEQEAINYLDNNAANIALEPGGDPDEWSIYEEMHEQDIELRKEKNYESSVVKWIP